MIKKQTLVILSPGFPRNEADSTCLPAQQSVIRAFNRQFPGVEIVVIAFQYPFSGEEYRWHENRIIPLNGRNRHRLHRLQTWLRGGRALRQLARTRELIGILSFWLDECSFVGHRFARRNQIPHYTWLLGQDARPGNRYVKWIKPTPHSLVAISDFVAKTFYENYRIRPQHVVTNGIDPALYPRQQQRKDIDILGVGSLIPLKRFDWFINIVKNAVQSIPHLKAVICGKGPEEARLKELIVSNHLTNHITLTGEIGHEEVLGMMQRSKILLHTSAYEGFSGACLEALYAGAHVISCFNPQDAWIRHWHVSDSEQQMLDYTLEILSSADIDFTPSLPYKMSDTAAQLMRLFTER